MKKLLTYLWIWTFLFYSVLSMPFLFLFVYLSDLTNFLSDEEKQQAWYINSQLITNVKQDTPKGCPVTWSFNQSWWWSFDWHIETEWASAVDLSDLLNTWDKDFESWDLADYSEDKLTWNWRAHSPLKVFSTISWKVKKIEYVWKWWWWQTCKYLPWKITEWTSYWNVVIIENSEYQVIFSHLSSFNDALKVWDEVWLWTFIWIMWNTWCSSWPHLHYEIKKKSYLWIVKSKIDKTEYFSLLWNLTQKNWKFYCDHVWLSFTTWVSNIEWLQPDKEEINSQFDEAWQKYWIDSSYLKALWKKESWWTKNVLSWDWWAWIMQFTFRFSWINDTSQTFWLVDNETIQRYKKWKEVCWNWYTIKENNVKALKDIEKIKEVWCYPPWDKRFDTRASIMASWQKISWTINWANCKWNENCAFAAYNWWNWTFNCSKSNYFDLDAKTCYDSIVSSWCSNWNASYENIKRVCDYVNSIRWYADTFKSWMYPD